MYLHVIVKVLTKLYRLVNRLLRTISTRPWTFGMTSYFLHHTKLIMTLVSSEIYIDCVVLAQKTAKSC